MDSMELEREKGITIKSAATYCRWRSTRINIIDTPGHVDFTIEVERALRVLDGAVLVLCSVSGVQSQTITVDRQMRRYNVPRIAFINKLDRLGANPWLVIDKLRAKLKHNAAALQVPIGSESSLRGLIDIVEERAIFFSGEFGQVIEEQPVPVDALSVMHSKKRELLECLANVDDQMAEFYLSEEMPPKDVLKAAIRRCTIQRKFLPVMMGSAFRNVGVQSLLDGVAAYLPDPTEVSNIALRLDGSEVALQTKADMPFVGLAFKLEESRFGQLTYIRVYQGRLARGQSIYNINGEKKVKVPRLVRMHSEEMEDVDSVGVGEICAVFGVECSSGDTFMDDASDPMSLTPMHVPDAVISLSIKPANKEQVGNFSKALARFQREDPTFRVHLDAESGETIISGMGELHLEIYVERMKREYGCPCVTGKPQVAFRETIQHRAPFDYTHKKQSGGAGQFGRVVGYIEPMRSFEEGSEPATAGPATNAFRNEFVSRIVGGAIPTELIPACEKGFKEATQRGSLIGHPVVGVRMVVVDGSHHVVDSNEYSFRTAASTGFRRAYEAARPIILEPLMKVSVTCPLEFQGSVMSSLNRRRGLIVDSETQEETWQLTVEVPLNTMFGYSTELRSLTQGKGEFGMEYKTHRPVLPSIQAELIAAANKKHQ